MKTKIGIALSLVFALGACSHDSGNKPVLRAESVFQGVYQSRLSREGRVSHVTSFHVESEGSSQVSVRVFRNGLSVDEAAYFNSEWGGEAVHWADDHFGREILLDEVQSSLNAEGRAQLSACGSVQAFAGGALEVRPCFLVEQVGSDDVEGVLQFYVYEEGELLEEPLEGPFELFQRDRWAADYFGNWQGKVFFQRQSFPYLNWSTGNEFLLAFQPISSTHYIFRPYDSNHSLMYGNERFVLQPFDRPLSELEKTAHPELYFVYVSEQSGARRIVFSSHIQHRWRLEGNIYLEIEGQYNQQLGTFGLDKQ